MKNLLTAITVLALASSATAQWEVGDIGTRDWPAAAGQSTVFFAQEANVNPPPGDPNSAQVNQQADDDYYFAGEYPAPIGVLGPRATALTNGDEWAVERAFAGDDIDLRFHFNLPADLDLDNDMIRVGTRANNLHDDGGDTRYGVEIFFNDILVRPEQVIRPGDLTGVTDGSDILWSDPMPASALGVTAADLGPGTDHVVNVHGVSYNDDGGGNWMGMDYHAMEISPVPEPTNVALILGIVWTLPVLLYGKKRMRRS